MTVPDLEIHLDEHDLARSLRADVTAGLTAEPKWLPPRWFYDARGSELFELITELPEYYPTRTERALLHEHAAEIAAVTAAGGVDTLVELGSGSSEKTRLLLDALSAAGPLRRYVRDWVDGKRNLAEFLLPGIIVFYFPTLLTKGSARTAFSTIAR